jgi:hypothetical protein
VLTLCPANALSGSSLTAEQERILLYCLASPTPLDRHLSPQSPTYGSPPPVASKSSGSGAEDANQLSRPDYYPPSKLHWYIAFFPRKGMRIHPDIRSQYAACVRPRPYQCQRPLTTKRRPSNPILDRWSSSHYRTHPLSGDARTRQRVAYWTGTTDPRKLPPSRGRPYLPSLRPAGNLCAQEAGMVTRPNLSYADPVISGPRSVESISTAIEFPAVDPSQHVFSPSISLDTLSNGVQNLQHIDDCSSRPRKTVYQASVPAPQLAIAMGPRPVQSLPSTDALCPSESTTPQPLASHSNTLPSSISQQNLAPSARLLPPVPHPAVSAQTLPTASNASSRDQPHVSDSAAELVSIPLTAASEAVSPLTNLYDGTDVRTSSWYLASQNIIAYPPAQASSQSRTILQTSSSTSVMQPQGFSVRCSNPSSNSHVYTTDM